MPKIDQFRIAELDERLSKIAKRIEDIRQPIKPYHPGTSDERAAVAMGDYIARAEVNGRLEKFIHPGGDLAQWAADVVDAFGVDRFPLYSKGPPEPELDVDSAASLSRLLTGVDDAVQAGLRITLWSAACQKPDLFDGARGDWNFRCCPMEKLFVREGESYRPRTEPMEWVRSAFDQLVANYNATQIKEPPPSSPPEEDESAYVLASVLMNQYSFESYAKLTSFLTKYAIRTRKPSLNRLLVHAGDFAKQIERRDEEQIEALDQSEEFIKGAQERQVEIREKKKKGQK